ncbi:MAG: ABC transporter ATP-binding protein [Pseudomonadota bacterium]
MGALDIVKDVSLAIEAGRVTCLLGPSGCGKSTTLRMIAGVETPDSGSVIVDGRSVCGPAGYVPAERRGIGLIFQDFALFPHLSVAGNISFGLRGEKSAMRRRVDALLERVHMTTYRNAMPHELSGGEQQRVALARAIAPKPSVMLMDEPFSGLDNRLRDGIRDDTLDILKEEKTAVLLVTHEPEEAMRMADEIALMRNGKLVQTGAPYNVYNTPVDKAAAAFFSDVNIVHGISRGALTETMFGAFLTPGIPDGTPVEIAIRPQYVGIDFGRAERPRNTIEAGTPVKGIVKRARYMGSESLVEFALEGTDRVFRATVASVFLPKPGTGLWLTLRRDKCFIFPGTPTDLS